MAASAFDQIGQQPTQSPAGGMADQWRGFLAKPENRAALLQFGVSMLGSRGGGFARNLSTSVGHAATARSKNLASQAESSQSQFDQGLKVAELGISERKAAAEELKARKYKGGSEDSTKGQVTPKDETEMWMDFAGKQLELNPETPIANLRQQFQELRGGAGASAPGAITGGPATQMFGPAYEGKIVRDQTTGQMFRVTNGRAVPQ